MVSEAEERGEILAYKDDRHLVAHHALENPGIIPEECDN
jgi:hypothetical protein